MLLMELVFKSPQMATCANLQFSDADFSWSQHNYYNTSAFCKTTLPSIQVFFSWFIATYRCRTTVAGHVTAGWKNKAFFIDRP